MSNDDEVREALASIRSDFSWAHDVLEAQVRRLQQIKALVETWRAEGSRLDSAHATMGIGWRVCADELEAALGEGRT